MCVPLICAKGSVEVAPRLPRCATWRRSGSLLPAAASCSALFKLGPVTFTCMPLLVSNTRFQCNSQGWFALCTTDARQAMQMLGAWGSRWQLSESAAVPLTLRQPPNTTAQSMTSGMPGGVSKRRVPRDGA